MESTCLKQTQPLHTEHKPYHITHVGARIGSFGVRVGFAGIRFESGRCPVGLLVLFGY